MSWNPLAALAPGDPAASRDKTTRNIAVGLLCTFIASIGALFIINYQAFRYGEAKFVNVADTIVKADEEMRKAWFDILKNSLILLGTALTTVIGYYFGQREGAVKAAEAERKEAKAEAKAAEANDRAENVVKASVNNTDAALRQGASAQSDSPTPAGNQAPSSAATDGIELP